MNRRSRSLGHCRCLLNIHLIDIQISYLISKALLRLNCAMAVLANLRCHSAPLFGVRFAEEESMKIFNKLADSLTIGVNIFVPTFDRSKHESEVDSKHSKRSLQLLDSRFERAKVRPLIPLSAMSRRMVLCRAPSATAGRPSAAREAPSLPPKNERIESSLTLLDLGG